MYHKAYHPVQWVVSAVANIDGDFTESSLENWMSHLTLHVVRRLVEITDARNVILTRLADNVTVVADNH
jgi:phosphatidylserine decarboxylase